MKNKRGNKGFTFIEMLVVISIIAVLTLVGVTNFRVANKKARDGKRKGDLEQIRAALEIYRTDIGVYPDTITFGAALTEGGDTYMEEVPNDPLSGNTYVYNSSVGGATYSLCAALELETPDVGACSDSCGTEACNYQVDSPL